MKENEIKRLVKEVYDIIAEGYYHLRTRPWPIVSKIADAQVIADIGCGVGHQLIYVIKLSTKKYGLCIDLSHAMLKKAKKNFKKLKLTNFDLIQADAEYVPLRNNSVDGLLMIAVLHHLPSKSRINSLSEVRRVLKVKGKALITVWALLQPRFILKYLINVIKYILGAVPSPKDFMIPWKHRGKKYMRYYHLFTKKEFEKLLREFSKLEILELGVFNFRKTLYPQNYYALLIKSK